MQRRRWTLALSWARSAPMEITRKMRADRRIYFISDLHIGDGTRSDAFLGKDRELMALLDRVRAEEAHLVIVGDALDFHQALSMERVLKAHARLIGELSRLADTHGVTYIWGNHDYDISLFKDLLRFDVCSTLLVGDRVLVQHGYQFDPFIGPNLNETHLATVAHHLLERALGSWLRLPMSQFYTLPNRLFFWGTHKFALVWDLLHRAATAAGAPGLTEKVQHAIWYWTQNELGDPGCLVEGVEALLRAGPYDTVVTGHSHLPGQVELAPGRRYVNTGSWTFNSAQVTLWDGADFLVWDWISGKSYGDRLYRPIVERRWKHMGFREWWRENYLGGLHFRVGAEAACAPLEPPPPLPSPAPAEPR